MQKLIVIGGFSSYNEEKELGKFLNDGWQVIHQTPVRKSKDTDYLYVIIEKNTRKEKLEHFNEK